MAEGSGGRPLLIFDGDCGFCRRFVERWRVRAGTWVDFAPYQEVAERFPQIPREHFTHAVHLVLPDGQVLRGAEAVFRVLAFAPGGGWMLWLYRHLPGFAPVSEFGYGLVARNRVLTSKVTKLLVGPDVTPATYARACWLFLRALGVVFLIAFLSFWVQMPGLIGSQGIEPAAETMRWARSALGGASLQLPTVFWFGASDTALHAVCGMGAALSVLVVLGVAQRACLFALWGLYLSLVTVGGVFLGYQWDVLLVETALLAAFLAPASLRPLPAVRLPHRPGALFLLRWLLFRLMLLSGLVKLTSHDVAWAGLRALGYHFWTQPLPTPLAYLAQRLPQGVLRAGVAAVFFIELLLPFFIFGTRRMRRAAALGFAVLQVTIALTGNYGFFNLLTLVLCLLLVEDGFWARRLRRPLPPPGPPVLAPAWRRLAFAAFGLLLFSVGVAEAARRLGVVHRLPPAVEALLERAAPFASVNTYGLFAVMTTERPEIEVEGSDDGEHWKPYLFRYKPGPTERAPSFVAPHQPRLDWQMWFAALGECRGNPWFLAFQQRLLEGSKPVLALLADNPFPAHPPRFVRSTVDAYHFTPAGAQGYWTREPQGPYCPPLMLSEGGELQRARP